MTSRETDLVVERVLCAVELVPPGHVVSYGDIADLVGTSARRVGAIMATQGGQVPWWRITNASGRLPEHLTPLASRHWLREGTAMEGGRCVMPDARADLVRLAHDYAAASADLV